MPDSPARRRAMFANMRNAQRHRFPLRGKTERVKRNRALALAIGGGAAGASLVLGTEAGRRMGPIRSLTGLTGYREPYKVVNVNGQDVLHGTDLARHGAFHGGSRVASRSESFAAETLGRLAPQLRRELGFRYTRDTKRGARIWEVGTAPLDGRIRAALPKVLARRIERSSIWSAFGRGGLLDFIEQSSLHGQDAARGAAKRRLTAAAERLEGKVGPHLRRRLLRPLRRANVRLAMLTRRAGRALASSAARRLA